MLQTLTRFFKTMGMWILFPIAYVLVGVVKRAYMLRNYLLQFIFDDSTVWNAMMKLNHHPSYRTAQWIVYDVDWSYDKYTSEDVTVTLYSHPLPPEYNPDEAKELIQIDLTYSLFFGFTVTYIRDETTIYGSGFTVDEVFGDMPELDWFSMNDDYYYGVQTTSRDPGYKLYYGKSLSDLQSRDEEESFEEWGWITPNLEDYSLLDLLFETEHFFNPNEMHRTIRQFTEEYTHLPKNEEVNNIYTITYHSDNIHVLYVYDSCSVFVYNKNGVVPQNTVIPIGESELTEPIEEASQKEYSKISKLK